MQTHSAILSALRAVKIYYSSRVGQNLEDEWIAAKRGLVEYAAKNRNKHKEAVTFQAKARLVRSIEAQVLLLSEQLGIFERDFNYGHLSHRSCAV